MKTEILVAERQQAERALSESERRYRRLFAATTDYIYTVKVEQGRSVKTTHGPGCAAVTGYRSAEFSADPFLWYRVIHEDDRPEVLEQTARILAGEMPPPLEHRLLHKQGGVRWVRNTPIPHWDTQGHLVAYDGMISDITSRKRAELLLAADYAVTRELAEVNDLAAAMPRVLEHLCRILFWHHAVHWSCEGNQLRRERGFWRAPLRAADFEPSSVRGSLPLGVGLPGRVGDNGEAIWVPDLARVPELAPAAPPVEAGLHCACAFPVRSDHKILGVIELYGREIQDADEGMLEALKAVGFHIGQFVERERSNDHLEEERNLLRTLIDNLPDCIFVKDAQSRFVLNNLAHLQMLGAVEPEDAFGKTDLDYFPAEIASRYREDEKGVIQSSLPLLNQEEPVMDRTGRHYWFLCTKVPLKNAGGKTIGLVGIGRDITERKHAAERLEHAYAQLAKRGKILKTMVRQLKSSKRQLEKTQMQLIQIAKMESVGTLAAGVAHEVKNPLQTILLGVHYLSQKFSGRAEDVTLTLDEMRDAVNRANGIIRELLGLSAANDFQRKPGDLNVVIERSLWLMHNELIAAHIEVKQELRPSLPKIRMDAGKLEQVFINCFLNAIQAMADGGTLTVKTRDVPLEREPSDYGPLFNQPGSQTHVVVAEIEDTGAGIAEADLSRVFDPFFTTKPVGLGSGLGLSVSRKIVELHEGEIEIQNRLGGGARVTITLKV